MTLTNRKQKWLISATFYLGKRKTPPSLNTGTYKPHLVVEGDETYLGIQVVQGESFEFGKEIHLIIEALYEDVNYTKLDKGKAFHILEGNNVVGEGRVETLLKV